MSGNPLLGAIWPLLVRKTALCGRVSPPPGWNEEVKPNGGLESEKHE